MMNGGGFVDTALDIGKTAVEFHQYYEELDQFKKDWSKNPNECDIAITVTLGRRQLDGHNNQHGDSNDLFSKSTTFGINRGEWFDREKYLWFEYMKVKSISIKPHIGVIMNTPGWFGYDIYLFNDTEYPQNYEWSYFLQTAVRTIQVVNTTERPDYNKPGTFFVYDPIWRKRSIIGLVLAGMFLILFISLMIYGNAKQVKQSFESNINGELIGH